ncbi:MAG: hypothetical protein MJ252_14915 [archaeon]|nr:hypothetical protein [archaeon]
MSKSETIFKDSLNKLNSMLLFLDTQLGTVSLTEEEINSLKFPENNQPMAKILRSNKDTTENKKEDKKGKGEKKPKAEKKPKEEKKTSEENKPKEEKKEKKPKGEKKPKEEKKEGEEKKENPKKENKPKAKGTDKNELFKQCDLRVGFVTKAEILEGFNEVYSLLIDLGEGAPRQIMTGLRNYVPLEELQNSKVIVFSNLKPKRFGTEHTSNGMIMCASIKTGDKKECIEIIRPVEKASVGDRVWLEGMELGNEKEETISGGKFQKAIENFATDENCFCMYNGIKMMTKDGNITVKTLKNAHIS